MSHRMTLREKEYLQGRVDEMFTTVIKRLEDRLIPVSDTIRSKVEKGMGLPQAEKEMDKLVEKLSALNKRYNDLTGGDYMPVKRITAPSYSGGRFKDGCPVDREVDAQVDQTKEAQAYVNAKAQKQDAKDQVMLAGFSSDVLDLFKVEIPKTLKTFNGHKKLKA